MGSSSVALLLPYAGLLGLLLLGLSAQVVRLRLRHRVGLGTGGVEALERAIRVHGNFCEYVPLSLVLLALLAAAGSVPAAVLHGLAGALVLGRILHAVGLSGSGGPSPARKLGTVLTWLVLLASGLLGLLSGWVGG